MQRRRSAYACSWFIAALLVFVAGQARGQKSDGDADLFRAPATSGGVLGLDSGFVGPHLSPAAFIDFIYTHEALVVRQNGREVGAVLPHQFDAQLGASLSLWGHLELGVMVPVLIDQTTNTDLYPGVQKSGLGNIRVEAKLHFGAIALQEWGRLGFGVALSLALPTYGNDTFYSDATVVFRPRAMASLWTKWVDVTLQVGAAFRGSRGLADVELGQQLQLGLGARVRIWRGLFVDGSIAGLLALSGTMGEAGDPFEALAGPGYRFATLPFEIIAAAGGGVTSGFGAPDFRALVSLRYQPRDSDGDGVPDHHDRCPWVPGPRQNQGCPDRDSDGDGVIDRLDQCPTVAGPVENHGCPWPDRDGDGVLDKDDACPDAPGPVENRGCPDTDRDHDGVVDRLDQCPTVPGPVENHGCPWPDRDQDGVIDRDDQCPDVPGPVENRGCPDKDTDGDGIVDRLDKCPHEKETFNGFEDEDGCPDNGPELAVLTPTHIEIRQQVFFDTGKATIKPQSFPLLATIAHLMSLHPEIKKLRVEGHTDNHGKHDLNVRLSKARAEAVMKKIIDDGIAADRLTAEGYGPDRPVADNKTTAGRAKNRRSEFVIVDPAPALP